jgi:hypothetical protein
MNTTEYQQLVQFLTSQFAGIDRRFDGLREELHSHFRETNGHLDEIYRRLERQQLAALQLRIDDLEQRLRP